MMVPTPEAAMSAREGTVQLATSPAQDRPWEIRHDDDRDADEVVGRIETVVPFGPLTLVVDGRAVAWDELGQALSSYEGWQFVLCITDRFSDPRH
jgi:hypothetical protein